jgi:hypothetical protein
MLKGQTPATGEIIAGMKIAVCHVTKSTKCLGQPKADKISVRIDQGDISTYELVVSDHC